MDDIVCYRCGRDGARLRGVYVGSREVPDRSGEVPRTAPRSGGTQTTPSGLQAAVSGERSLQYSGILLSIRFTRP